MLYSSMRGSAMEQRWSIFVRAVIDGDVGLAASYLTANPELAEHRVAAGATRGVAAPFFHADIAHYCYTGDTALHMAAAGFQSSTARLLVEKGAALDARNRMGAAPLHYAADTNHWNPTAQSQTITYLLSAGAPVNAVDARGVTALHRAVRTRSAMAVRALLAGGADVQSKNNNGSAPYDLAVRATGRGGAGSTRAREQQAEILALLLEAGARPPAGSPAAPRG